MISTSVGGANGDELTADVARVDPKGMARDSLGNLYIADAANNRVRKIDAL
ncbi:MAG: hypothetical protein HY699_07380, partial [Deltaproteobacteria bacterium]|nr:hypothetical protein [Deltaproteobacteria bacterium]